MLLRFKYKIKYQDLDHNRTLKPSKLEEYLLDTAGDAAKILGIGYHVLLARDMAWVLIRLAIDMHRMPGLEDEMIVETFVSSFSHGLSARYFRLLLVNEKGEEEEIGTAGSMWAVINLKTRQMESIFEEELFKRIELHEPLKISVGRIRPESQTTGMREHEIVYSDIDYNRHCNSCKYLDMMLNAYSDLYTGMQPLRVSLNYIHELYEGEVADVEYTLKDKSVQYTIRRHTDHSIAVMGELSVG